MYMVLPLYKHGDSDYKTVSEGPLLETIIDKQGDSPPHLNLIRLQLLTALKEVNGEFGSPCTPTCYQTPFSTFEYGQGTRRLEVLLQPVLSVGVLIGHIYPETTILT